MRFGITWRLGRRRRMKSGGRPIRSLETSPTPFVFRIIISPFEATLGFCETSFVLHLERDAENAATKNRF